MVVSQLLAPSFQGILIFSSLSFFWIGVHFGSKAFDHLTGLNAILLAKHSRIKGYQGDTRSEILRKLDIAIAQNGPSIEDSELFPQEKQQQRVSNHPTAELSKKTAYGVLNDTSMHDGVYIPSVYRRNLEDVEKFVKYMKYRPEDLTSLPLPTPLLIVTYYRAG